ncbi:MAG: hypothetical protein IH881_14580 [Myxococcales bacterium]|nr:hypothetical protein [Myxococcales bacterium]
MNPWDLLTWVAAVLLAASALTIFVFFAKDAREIFRGESTDRDKEN